MTDPLSVWTPVLEFMERWRVATPEERERFRQEAEDYVERVDVDGRLRELIEAGPDG